MILRDRDTSGDWHEMADGTRDERVYYAQNWRGDVSALLTDTGSMIEWVKYSAYGVPYALPAGDTDSNGTWDAADEGRIGDAIGVSYDVRYDTMLTGEVTDEDIDHANSIAGGYQTLGRGVMSSSAVANRVGYAGYRYDPTFKGASRTIYHVRHRVYDADVGRWTRRDPLGYVDGMSLYEYVASMPVLLIDPWGLCSRSCNACVVALAGAGIGVASLTACAASGGFNVVACGLALAALGPSVYGVADSCHACAACTSAAHADDDDPGAPITRNERCVAGATSGQECAACCSDNYSEALYGKRIFGAGGRLARTEGGCYNDPRNDVTLCDKWDVGPIPWGNRCRSQKLKNLSNCINDAGRAYNACIRNCIKTFPRQDPIVFPDPTNPVRDMDLPTPDRPLCTAMNCGRFPSPCGGMTVAAE